MTWFRAIARSVRGAGLIPVAAFLLLASTPLALAQSQRFETLAPHALLMDFGTGTVLFEKGADDLVAPASMAKLMTVAVVLDEVKRGRLKLEDEFSISENAWRRGGAPSGGSTMFAALGSRVSIRDLLIGAIVLSGNDSAIALAEGVAGSEENFARMMTARARGIGMKRSVFKNPTGYGDPEQKVTVRELAILSRHIIETYPEHYPMFALKEATWNKKRQQNRNPLLSMDIGADGLKTGNINESGFGLAGSAVQNGQRLVVVVNGLKTAQDRAQESRKLLEWGFRAFETRQLFPEGAVVGQARVYGGEEMNVDLAAKGPVQLLVPRGSQERINARIVYRGPLMPPVAKGDEVARLQVTRGDVQALDIPLFAAQDMTTGSITRRAIDAAAEFGSGLVRRAFGGART